MAGGKGDRHPGEGSQRGGDGGVALDEPPVEDGEAEEGAEGGEVSGEGVGGDGGDLAGISQCPRQRQRGPRTLSDAAQRRT